MKNPRLIVLAVLMAIAVALLSASAYAFYGGSSVTTTYQSNVNTSGTNGYYPSDMMGGHMGSGMMGSWWMSGESGTYSAAQTPTSTQNSFLPLVGFTALIGAVVSGIGGAAYYLAYPKTGLNKTLAESRIENPPQTAVTPYTSISKTLTSEERRVLDVLVAHNGEYLQKYVRKETGLTRLKTHRIIARFAERGIVTLEKSGNTNRVRLSNWLKSQPEENTLSLGQTEMREIEVET